MLRLLCIISCRDMYFFGSSTVTLGNMQGTWSRGHLQSSHQLPRQLLADVITVCVRKLSPRFLQYNTNDRQVAVCAAHAADPANEKLKRLSELR